jgi:hypothetical protein
MKHDLTILSLLDQPIKAPATQATDKYKTYNYAVVKAMRKLLINYLKILKIYKLL